MFQLIPRDLNIDFLKMSKPFVILSTLAVIASGVAVFKPGLNYGIDFTGGTEVQVRVPSDAQTDSLRDALAAGGLKDAAVIKIEDSAHNDFIVKVPSDEKHTGSVTGLVESALSSKFGTGDKFQVLKADVVGPQAGEELRFDAIFSVLAAALGILIYITFRFDVRFAPGIVRALLFDVIVTLGVWVALGKEFNLGTVAALLTIAGYSCNDTIVIYDRIRDFNKQYPSKSLYEIVNMSINLNLGRTFLTVISTNFVVVSLWIWGGPVIGDFALVMLIGFTISIFSTIFVSNPMVMYMEKRRMDKEKHSKTNGSGGKRPQPQHV